jgi:CRP/FNR family transcriptional regulator, dissimilatory nitrate respiration regulator
VSASSTKVVEDILAGLPVFRHVAPAQLHRLAGHAELRHAAKDTRLYERGEPSTGCFALVYGLVTLSLLAPDGTTKVLRLVHPGETFAESVMFDVRPQPVNALVLADSQLVFLPAQAIFDLLAHDRTFMRALLASLSRRIHVLIADIEAYSLSSGTQRVAAYLHGLADTSSPEPARVRLPANKTIIASRLGVTKETFSRLLHELSRQGLIEVRQREVVLRDPLRLAQLAQGITKP